MTFYTAPFAVSRLLHFTTSNYTTLTNTATTIARYASAITRESLAMRSTCGLSKVVCIMRCCTISRLGEERHTAVIKAFGLSGLEK